MNRGPMGVIGVSLNIFEETRNTLERAHKNLEVQILLKNQACQCRVRTISQRPGSGSPWGSGTHCPVSHSLLPSPSLKLLALGPGTKHYLSFAIA